MGTCGSEVAVGSSQETGAIAGSGRCSEAKGRSRLALATDPPDGARDGTSTVRVLAVARPMAKLLRKVIQARSRLRLSFPSTIKAGSSTFFAARFGPVEVSAAGVSPRTGVLIARGGSSRLMPSAPTPPVGLVSPTKGRNDFRKGLVAASVRCYCRSPVSDCRSVVRPAPVPSSALAEVGTRVISVAVTQLTSHVMGAPANVEAAGCAT